MSSNESADARVHSEGGVPLKDAADRHESGSLPSAKKDSENPLRTPSSSRIPDAEAEVAKTKSGIGRTPLPSLPTTSFNWANDAEEYDETMRKKAERKERQRLNREAKKAAKAAKEGDDKAGLSDAGGASSVAGPSSVVEDTVGVDTEELVVVETRSFEQAVQQAQQGDAEAAEAVSKFKKSVVQEAKWKKGRKGKGRETEVIGAVEEMLPGEIDEEFEVQQALRNAEREENGEDPDEMPVVTTVSIQTKTPREEGEGYEMEGVEPTLHPRTDPALEELVTSSLAEAGMGTFTPLKETVKRGRAPTLTDQPSPSKKKSRSRTPKPPATSTAGPSGTQPRANSTRGRSKPRGGRLNATMANNQPVPGEIQTEAWSAHHRAPTPTPTPTPASASAQQTARTPLPPVPAMQPTRRGRLAAAAAAATAASASSNAAGPSRERAAQPLSMYADGYHVYVKLSKELRLPPHSACVTAIAMVDALTEVANLANGDLTDVHPAGEKGWVAKLRSKEKANLLADSILSFPGTGFRARVSMYHGTGTQIFITTRTQECPLPIMITEIARRLDMLMTGEKYKFWLGYKSYRGAMLGTAVVWLSVPPEWTDFTVPLPERGLQEAFQCKFRAVNLNGASCEVCQLTFTATNRHKVLECPLLIDAAPAPSPPPPSWQRSLPRDGQ